MENIESNTEISEEEYLNWTGDFGGKIALDKPSSYYLSIIKCGESIEPPEKWEEYHQRLIKWAKLMYKMQEANEKGNIQEYERYVDLMSNEDEILMEMHMRLANE